MLWEVQNDVGPLLTSLSLPTMVVIIPAYYLDSTTFFTTCVLLIAKQHSRLVVSVIKYANPVKNKNIPYPQLLVHEYSAVIVLGRVPNTSSGEDVVVDDASIRIMSISVF